MSKVYWTHHFISRPPTPSVEGQVQTQFHFEEFVTTGGVCTQTPEKETCWKKSIGHLLQLEGHSLEVGEQVGQQAQVLEVGQHVGQ